MQPIQAVDSSPENDIGVEFVEPIKTSTDPVVFIFLRSAPRSKSVDNPKTKQKVAAKPPKKAKKDESDESVDVAFIPELAQLILCKKDNSFLPKDKEEVLFHIEACQAKIVTEGWRRYGEHLAEEAALKRSYDLKKRKRLDQMDSQDKRFLIEREEIKKQDLRFDMQSEEASKVDVYVPTTEPTKRSGRDGKFSDETISLTLLSKRQACQIARRRQSVRGG